MTCSCTSPNQKTFFQTKDADLAAYLCARAYPIMGLESHSSATLFSFPREAELSATAYYQNASISAKSLLSAVRKLHQLTTNQLTTNRGLKPLHV
jgi:hypothetical protein